MHINSSALKEFLRILSTTDVCSIPARISLSHSLRLCLFGDVFDCEPLLANDGSHKLRGHQHTQGEVWLFLSGHQVASRGPGLRVLFPCCPSTATIPGRRQRWSSIHIQNIRHFKGVILKRLSC